MNQKKSEGSRFAILNDIVKLETIETEANPHIDTQVRGAPTNVLSEISNRKQTGKNQVSNAASKYLVDAPITEIFSKPFKENTSEKGFKRYGKGIRKNSQQVEVTSQGGMEDDLDDSGVLQNLHKKMMETNQVGFLAPETPQVEVVLDTQQIDVTGNANFEDIAANLKEAMAMTVE